jgi:hypothetical protein
MTNKQETPNDVQVQYREGEGETAVEEEHKDARVNRDSLLFCVYQGGK